MRMVDTSVLLAVRFSAALVASPSSVFATDLRSVAAITVIFDPLADGELWRTSEIAFHLRVRR